MFYDSYPRYRMSLDHHRREALRDWEAKKKLIINHPEVWKYTSTCDGYSERNPFVYVSELFPKLKDQINYSEIYVIENTYFWWAKAHLPREAGGLYVPSIGVIFLARLHKPPLELQDILVHELLHRTSHLFGQMISESIEEAFAFSYSIDWFKKWHTKEVTIEKYLLPYCTYLTCQKHQATRVTSEIECEARIVAENLFNHKTGDIINVGNLEKDDSDVWDFL